MPIYEYKCPNCGRFELKQNIKDDSQPLSHLQRSSSAPHRKECWHTFKGPGLCE